MLVEIRNVKQEPGRFRRWFESDTLELIVWQAAPDAAVDGFQLVYRNVQEERALTWRKASGFAHACVQTGDTHPLKNSTPVLVTTDEAVPWTWLSERFERESERLEPQVQALVRARLAERR